MTVGEDREKIRSDKSENHPDILIEGGTLLSMVDGEAPMENASVYIVDNRIEEIRQGIRHKKPDGAECIKARDCIIMPGLINGHGHSAMTLFRGYADDLPLKQWLFEKIFPAESEFLSPESVYWGTMLACLEMISSGTTGVIESYFFEDNAAQAIHQSGLRALVAQGVIDFPAPGVKNPENNLAVAREFIEKWLDISPLITPGIFCHSPVTCSEQTFVGAHEMSREFGSPLQTHLSETSEEVKEVIRRTGKRPVQYLDGMGILGHDLIAAHSVHLNDEEIELLRKRGVGVVHVPESNMKLASGIADVTRMLGMGITIGLGTDGCASNNNLDLIKEMDIAAKLGKIVTADPVNMNAETVLKMATSRGARLMGLEKETGTVEKGKKADIIVVDMTGPHLVPLYNPMSAIVYSANGADVKDVIVNGRILMKDRDIKTLDKEEILIKVKEICRKMGTFPFT